MSRPQHSCDERGQSNFTSPRTTGGLPSYYYYYYYHLLYNYNKYRFAEEKTTIEAVIMKTSGGVVWPFFVVWGTLLAVGARGICDNNSINYAGNYTWNGYGISSVDEKGNAIRLDDVEALWEIFPAPPNSAGSREYSYWVHRYVGDTLNISVPTPVLDATVEKVSKIGPADTLCVAPPFELAGLQCVDLEDAGMFKLIPLEVDADCNLIKGYGAMSEPKTPGCEGPLCYPAIALHIFSRRGSEGVQSIPLASGN